MEHMSARHPSWIASLGREAILANYALLPSEALIRRIYSNHQVRFVELAAGEVLAVLWGNALAVLISAAFLELSVELFGVNDAGMSP